MDADLSSSSTRKEKESGSATSSKASPILPRPIPAHSSSSFSIYSRTRGPSHSPSHTSTASSPNQSDTESSSPSSHSGAGGGGGSAGPGTLRRRAASSTPSSPLLPRRSLSGVFPLEGLDRLVDHTQDVSSASGLQSLEQLVQTPSSATSILSPSPTPIASSPSPHLTSALPLTTSQNLSIAPPKRSFAATPSFPSPLARASIVPQPDDEEHEEDEDVEPRSLEGAHDSAAGAQPASRRRRPSSSLLRSSSRTSSPNAMLFLPEKPNSPSPPQSSDAGSSGSAGDLNALGLSTRESRRRQASDTTSFRSGTYGEVGSGSGSVSTSPNRSRRRSEYLIPGQDVRKLASNYPIPTMPRPIPIAPSPSTVSSPVFAPLSMVSPLNSLPTPWGQSSSSSTSSSPTDSNSAGIRLQRVPTAVRLANDLLSSSPTVSTPLTTGSRSPKAEFFLGAIPTSHSPPTRPPLPSPTQANNSSSSLSALPHTPSATPETSPAPHNDPLQVLATPHPSPTGDLDQLQSYLSTSVSMPSTASRSAPKTFYGHGHSSSSRLRPSLPPPTAFDALLFPPSSSAESAQNLQSRYRERTSIHESSLAQSVGRSQGRDLQDFQSLSTSGGHDPDDYARYIMSTRSAKMQKWRRNSQASISSGAITTEAAAPVAPSLSWTSTGVSGMASKPELLEVPVDDGLVRSRTLPAAGELDEASPSAPTGAAQKGKDRRDGSSVMGTGTQNIEWVDWLDEYKQHKEAKIRAEFEGFTMPTKATTTHPGGGSGISHLVADASGLAGASRSDSVFSESPPIESSMPSSTFVRPAGAPRLGSDQDPLAVSPTTSRTEDASHRRSLSIRSLQAHELAKSSTHRLTTFFERPRNASTSTNRSRESFAVDLPKGKRHLGSKIEGWWKSVKSGFGSEPSTPKFGRGSGSSRGSGDSQGAVAAPPNAASSRISLHTSLPSTVKRKDAAASTSPTVVGFFPSNAVRTSPPVASLRNVTSAFDLKSGRSQDSPTAPPIESQMTARPRAISHELNFDNHRQNLDLGFSTSFGSSSSGDQSDETMNRKGQSSLEARRNQPRLSLKLERPSLEIPETSTAGGTTAGGSSSSDRTGGPLRPSGQGPSSRYSSGASNAEHLLPGQKPPQWAQTPSPLYAVLPDDPHHPRAAEEAKPSTSTTYPAFNAAAMHREIRQRLTSQKEVCNKELRKIINLITLFVEEKLVESENNRSEAAELDAFSAVDSQSDFGGDESDRGEQPTVGERRISRTHSRRTSVSTGSPIKRQTLLPRTAGLTSPARRRSNAAPPFRSAQQNDLRLAARKLNATMGRTSSNSSSRSTSRSRSPLPPGASLSPDGFSTEGEALPPSFLATLQEIIDIATEILDMPISALTARPGTCPEFVQKVQQVGTAWDEHSNWPGRGWYVQLLLAVAGLSRVVEWWEAEKGFWNFAQEGNEDIEPLHFVIKDSKVPAATSPLTASSTKVLPSPFSGLGLGFGGKPQFSSIGIRLDAAESPAQLDGERTAVPPKLEIADPTEDLATQVEQAKNVNMVLELSLDGEFVEWINPAWREVVGSNPSDILGNPIQDHLAPADGSVFAEATRELLKDDSHTVEARFRLQILPNTSDDEELDREPGPVYLEMDGSGMLMRDRFTGEASHTMWVIKPVVALPAEQEMPDMTADEPQTAGLGLGFHRRLPSQPVSPFPHGRSISIINVLCRICERQVPAWYFEKHNETCHEVHRLEADISERNEAVGDLLRQATELLLAIDESTPITPARYKNTPIFTLPSLTLPAEAVISPSRPQQLVVRTMQRAVVNQVVSVLQTALDISTPSIKEDAPDIPVEQQRLLSPRSEEYLTLANTWSKPSTEDPALALLIHDASTAIRNKINAVNRMRNTIVYSERVRHEWEDKVEKTLAALSEESSSDSDISEGESMSDVREREEAAEIHPEEPQRLSESPAPLLAAISVAGRASEPFIAGSPSEATSSSCAHGLLASASITSGSSSSYTSPPVVSSRPRRFSRQKSSDLVFVSTPPLSPSLNPVDSSPNLRTRKASVSGRPSFGSEGPLSPRIPSVAPTSRSTTISIKDFDILKPISKGAFGSVYLAKKNTTGDFFAIKVLKKADMISKNQITNVKAERKILMNQAESPYVVRLFFTFQNKHYLFLVMEYLPGGDVGALVKKLGTLDEGWTRTYIAEVVLGLESLHDKGVVHRDLKPDNLLIDAKGHLKLTDFGLSRIGLLGRQAGGSRFTAPPRGKSSRPANRPSSSRNPSLDSSVDSPMFSPQSLPGLSQSYFNHLTEPESRNQGGSADESSGSESVSGLFKTRPATISLEASFVSSAGGGNNPSPEGGTPPVMETHKFVGTVDYVAPESILGLGGDDAGVDWWALGVVMYELLYGCPPFNDDTPEKVFDNIISRRIHWPENDEDLWISDEARDLMERLMCTNPADRIGARGADEIKKHPFFADINWETLCTSEASFVPVVSEEISTDYFDNRGLIELPEELEVGNAVPDPVGESPSSVDDFGTFNFRNLSASKAANDQVVMDMRAQALTAATLAQPFEMLPPVINLHERRRSIDIRKRGRGALSLQDPKFFLINPPSPATSSSSGTSSNLPGGLAWQTHSRRTSELERVQGETDLNRRTSLPSRLRAGSTSYAASEPSPLAFSPPSSVSSPSDGPAAGHSRVQVLLAEDNPVSMKVVYGILTKLGIECATVSNGSDALAVATTCAFDVLFLDLRLPHLDGDHIARYLKSVAGPNFETPIVAVTALSEDDATISETGTLFSAVISKPITKENMLAVLLKLGFKVETAAGA